MKASATGSLVTNVTYSGNIATGIRQFGILIDQSYPRTLGTPGKGGVLSGVNFKAPTTSIAVNSGAYKMAVNCGAGACKGTWDWYNLSLSGGISGPIKNFSGILGLNQY